MYGSPRVLTLNAQNDLEMRVAPVLSCFASEARDVTSQTSWKSLRAIRSL